MKLRNAVAIVLCLFSVGGCASTKNDPERLDRTRPIIKELSSAYALPGTSTAVVGIGIDKKGIPLETVKEVVLLPGQKVIFAGPDRFQIKFKNEKSPAGVVKMESKDGVITVFVPKDVLDKPEFAREFKEKKYVRFDYSIYVNGKELDPPLIVRRDN